MTCRLDGHNLELPCQRSWSSRQQLSSISMVVELHPSKMSSRSSRQSLDPMTMENTSSLRPLRRVPNKEVCWLLGPLSRTSVLTSACALGSLHRSSDFLHRQPHKTSGAQQNPPPLPSLPFPLPPCPLFPVQKWRMCWSGMSARKSSEHVPAYLKTRMLGRFPNIRRLVFHSRLSATWIHVQP